MYPFVILNPGGMESFLSHMTNGTISSIIDDGGLHNIGIPGVGAPHHDFLVSAGEADVIPTGPRLDNNSVLIIGPVAHAAPGHEKRAFLYRNPC